MGTATLAETGAVVLPRPRVTVAISLVVALIAPPAAAPHATAAAVPRLPGEQSWAAATVGGQRLPDPRRATPQAVAAFFARLTPAQADELARTHPAIVGNLDGAPAALRFRANRRTIARSGLRYRGLAEVSRTFLAFDTRAGGRAVEVVGDLAAADHIAVIVPGVDTTLAVFDRGFGRRAYRAPARQARALHEALHAVDPAAKVAVIAWLGYAPPVGVGRAAVREEYAGAGAVALARLLATLHLDRPHATVTVLGHSYGSVVAGLAARRAATRIDDLVAVGSPGMGVDGVAGLPGARRVWAARAADDWIRWVPGIRLLGMGHGTDPMSPAFGARHFAVTGARGHDRYLATGTESLRNIARITLGRFHVVTTPRT